MVIYFTKPLQEMVYSGFDRALNKGGFQVLGKVESLWGYTKEDFEVFDNAEDLILAKLVWAKDSHSETQLKDARNIMESVDNLDLKYIKTWVAKLGLHEIFKGLKQ